LLARVPTRFFSRFLAFAIVLLASHGIATSSAFAAGCARYEHGSLDFTPAWNQSTTPLGNGVSVSVAKSTSLSRRCDSDPAGTNSHNRRIGSVGSNSATLDSRPVVAAPPMTWLDTPGSPLISAERSSRLDRPPQNA
jgi:hypothetical protein